MTDDDLALQELINSCHGRLVGLLRLRGCSPEEADDLTQEAMLRLVRSWSSSSDVENWWAWLVTVAVNLQVSQWRRLAVRARRSHLMAGATEYHDASTLEALDLLNSLSARQRTAVILRHYAGLSVRETAEAMGIPEGTVKSLTAAGRAVARRSLHDREVSR